MTQTRTPLRREPRTRAVTLAPALLLGAAALLAAGPPTAALGIPAAIGVPAAMGSPAATGGPTAIGVPTTMGVPTTSHIPTRHLDLLTVAYDDGAGHTRTYALTCGHEENGDDRDGEACAHLDEIGGPLPAVPEDQACSMIYGGPQTATVDGTWHGRRVTEEYRRTNGCEVARWSRMVPALPAPDNGAPETEDLRT